MGPKKPTILVTFEIESSCVESHKYRAHVNGQEIVRERRQRQAVHAVSGHAALETQRARLQQQQRARGHHGQAAGHTPAGARNLAHHVREHHVAVRRTRPRPAPPCRRRAKADVVTHERMRHAAGVVQLAILEQHARGDLLAHAVPRRLVEGAAVEVTAPAVVQAAQEGVRARQQPGLRTRRPRGARGRAVAGRQPRPQRTQVRPPRLGAPPAPHEQPGSSRSAAALHASLKQTTTVSVTDRPRGRLALTRHSPPRTLAAPRRRDVSAKSRNDHKAILYSIWVIIHEYREQ